MANKVVDTYVIDADKKWQVFGEIRELYNYRYLLRNLVVRDIKIRYKNSVLGFLWSFLNPLMMMMVYTILFTILIPNNGSRNYSIFILVALIPWQFLSASLMGSTGSIVNSGALIKKVYLPRVLLPISVVLSNLVNFFLSYIILLIFLFASGTGLTINALWVPIILLAQIALVLGLGFLFSTLQTFFRDTMMILEVGLLAWFFLTPVFYPYEQLSESATLWGFTFNPAVVMRWFNPMASIVDGYRTVLWGTTTGSGSAGMDPAYMLRTMVIA
ncbi:MAG: ABC transporter permease, partial [Anaerolineales bacterium]|nr:ABC transporter permease [Anaerolineales bacterium]